MKKRTTFTGIIISIVMLCTCLLPELKTSAASATTYDQYLADYLCSNETAKSYLERDWQVPYRTFVEAYRNDPEKMADVDLWVLATFDGNIVGENEKLVAYYETILYDIILGDGSDLSGENVVQSISDNVAVDLFKATADVAKEFAEIDKDNALEELPKYLETLPTNDPEFNKLFDVIVEKTTFLDILESEQLMLDIVSSSENVYDVVQKASNLQALCDTKEEMKIILGKISDASDNINMKQACKKMCANLDESLSNKEIIANAIAGEGISVLVDKLSGKVWDIILAQVDLTGLSTTIKLGQGIGKLASNVIFNTDEIVDCIFTMTALYDIEDIMVSICKSNAAQYKSNSSVENAKLLNTSYEVMMRIYFDGVKYSRKFIEATVDKGLFNYIMELFHFKNTKESDKLLDQCDELENMFKNFFEYIDHFVYNNYISSIPVDTAYSQMSKKVIVSAKTSSMTAAEVAELTSLSQEIDQLYTNHDFSESMTLSEDYHTYGDLVISGGTVDLNGHTMTVEGDLIQKGGSMVINSGILNVGGDYTLSNLIEHNEKTGEDTRKDTGKLVMQYANDYVNVHGDFITYSEASSGLRYSYIYNYLEKGTMTIYGNLYQHYGDGIDDGCSTNFQPNDETFHLVFKGKGVHEAYLENNSVWLGGLEEQDGATIKLTGKNRGFTLYNDIVIEGDMPLTYEKLDLNGHTMTIKGDLNQTGGAVCVGSGTLEIMGNYTISSTVYFDEKEGTDVRSETGRLYMVDAQGNLIIHGNFRTYSEKDSVSTNGVLDYSNYNCLGKGTMTIYGNLYEYSGEGLDDGYFETSSVNRSNFQPTSSTFHLVFKGKGVHEAYLEDIYAYLGGLEEQDGATITLTGKNRGITLYNDIVIEGDMPLTYGTLDLNGHTLTVKGNLNQTGGTLNVGGGTLLVYKDYTLGNTTHYDASKDTTYRDYTATLKMDDATGTVRVNGDLHVYSETSNTLQLGTLQIMGGLYQYSGDGLDDGYSSNFAPSSSKFNLVFNGGGVHEVYFESNSSTLTGLRIKNGAILTFTGVLTGITLNTDLVVQGDFPLNSGTMDLNGYTLTIQGDLTQTGGTLYINDGTLQVNGDYILSSGTHYDAKLGEEVRDTTGVLKMDNAQGCVNVKGDLIIKNETGNSLVRGKITVYGDLYQYSGDGIDDGYSNNFMPESKVNLIFAGAKTHYFTSQSTKTTTGTIVLTKGAKLVFRGSLAGLNQVEDASSAAEGNAVSSSGNTVTSKGSGEGTVTLTDEDGKTASFNIVVNDFRQHRTVAKR